MCADQDAAVLTVTMLFLSAPLLWLSAEKTLPPRGEIFQHTNTYKQTQMIFAYLEYNVCVCVWERERETLRQCVCVCLAPRLIDILIASGLPQSSLFSRFISDFHMEHARLWDATIRPA